MALHHACGRSRSLRCRRLVQHRDALPANGTGHALAPPMAASPRHSVAVACERVGPDAWIHPRCAARLHDRNGTQRCGPSIERCGNDMQRAPLRLLGKWLLQRSATASAACRGRGCGCGWTRCEGASHPPSQDDRERRPTLSGNWGRALAVRKQRTGALHDGSPEATGQGTCPARWV
jgi:hypothetical protein